MMQKIEQEFLIEFKQYIKKTYTKFFWHKIADAPTKYQHPKPFDLILAIEGCVMAIEAKQTDKEYFTYEMLRDSQKEGLTSAEVNGFRSMVLVYFTRKEISLLIPFHVLVYSGKVLVDDYDRPDGPCSVYYRVGKQWKCKYESIIKC